MSSSVYSKPPSAPPFSEWLRQLRTERNLVLRTVAAAADMDQASLSKIELGQRFPTEEQTKMLAKFFGVDETEALARRMASKFQHDGERTPGAVLKAVQILAEEAGIYRTTKGTKNTKGGA